MATAHPLPAPVMAEPEEAKPGIPGEAGTEQALEAIAPAPPAEEPTVLDGVVSRFPVQLDVAIPVRNFRVRKLLALEPGSVIETEWCSGDDLPLAAGEVQLAWSEFEVLDTQLAIRITHLA